jgi:hypothetical protein
VPSFSFRACISDTFNCQTVKDVIDDYDALANLLESIEYFLNRLEIYIEIPPAVAMNEMIVKILIELLSTLALATKQTKEGKLSESVIGGCNLLADSMKRRKACKEAPWRDENQGNGPKTGSTDAGRGSHDHDACPRSCSWSCPEYERGNGR